MTSPTRPPRPLSGAQEGIWFAQQLDPVGATFNTGEGLEIHGPVDEALFEAAARRTVEDAQTLRLTFTDTSGAGPCSRPAGAADPRLTVVDLSGADDPRAACEKWIHEDLLTPVDLVAGPLFSQALLKLAEDRYFWFLRAHHILLDGYGYLLVASRLAEVYTALAAGTEVPPGTLAPLSALLDEEAAYRASDRYARDRDHWARRLDGMESAEGLVEGTAPASAPFLRRTTEIGPGEGARLTEAARRMGVAQSDLLLAATAAYVHRATGATEVVLGTTTLSRLGSAALRTPGTASNILPLRVETGPGTTVLDLVRSVAREVRDVRAHQLYRAEDLRRDLKMLGGSRRLYGPVVNLVPFTHELTFGEHATTPHYYSGGRVEDLSIGVRPGTAGGQGLLLTFDANPALYTEELLADHQGRFLHVLDQLAGADGSTPLTALSLLHPDEWPELYPAHAPVPAPVRPAPDATLPARFEAQAARTPDAPAVTYRGTSLSYAALNARANRLARLLVDRGAGPGRTVALALPRSAELLVGVLAVLKTGAAYLPLDRDYPAERLRVVLEDGAPRSLVTDADSAALFPEVADTVVLGDPAVEEELATRAPRDLTDADRTAPLTPDDLAYVIHTSGSTGRPKGVEISHFNVVRLIESASAHMTFGADDVWSLFHSYSFDVSVWEMWGALLHGGRLVVVPQETTRAPEDLLALLRDEAVTVLSQTPSAFQQLVRADQESPHPARPFALRYVVFGGEALEPARLRPWVRRYGDSAPRLVNMYGITETTVHTTYFRVTRELIEEENPRSIIGIPLRDLRVHVLDHCMRPTPPGWLGEIHVSGPGVARGYLGRPDLTAERFVDDPFGAPGERMYRSGDLARRAADGTLEYVGRADHQVKIRGFRIEPGEIETALLRHPDVSDAAVVPRRNTGTDDVLLAAYVVPRPGAGRDPAAYREHLTGLLPPYMLPGAFVLLDALPLTASGKLDARALPDPDFVAAASGRAPSDGTEALLCRLYDEVLGLPAGTVGADDDFFALGGHSLLATRVVTLLRGRAGAELALSAIFETPTPAALAARLAEAGRSAASRPPVVPAERPGPLPLSAAQQSMWFLNQLDVTAATYNIPLVVRLEHEPDPAALRAALADVTDRFEILRTLLPQEDGAPHQRILPAGSVRPDLHVVDCPATEVDAYVSAACRHPFDLVHDLPLWAGLYGDAASGRTLVLVLHHAAADGWSLRPLAEALSTAYEARAAGRAPAFEALPVQYADFAVWQRDLLAGEPDPDGVMGRQLAYWRHALTGLPAETPLPFDRPRPAVPSHRGGSLRLTLDPEVHRDLLELAEDRGASLFMVLQAGLTALLTRAGGGTDIAIGTPVAGRADESLDGLVGYFSNTLVLRTDSSGDPAFTELLARVRAADLAAFDHQDLPFERLVDSLNPPRHAARHPLFQVMLALQNNTEAVLRLGGDTAALTPTPTGTAKFDLFLDVVERRDAQGRPDGLAWHVDYNADVFDHGTAAALAEHLHTLLTAVAADPARPLSALAGPPRAGGRTTAPAAGQPYDTAAVERALLAAGGLREVAVLPPGTLDPDRPVAFAVPTRAHAVEQAARQLSALDPAPRVTAVTALPRHPDGALDRDALKDMAPLDQESATAWQRALAAVPGVRTAAAALEEAPRELGRRYLPATTTRTRAEDPAAGPGAHAAPALSEGPPLPDPGVSTWAEALVRAAGRGPHAEIVHVRADGTETRRSYTSVIAEASRVLGGLRALGIRPGDTVVLQCEDTEDFVAALWGCVLGGFVAVPLTVPPSYTTPSAALNKLEGIWRNLDGPWVVTSRTHEPHLRGLAERRNWPDPRIATVDELREAPSDEDWYRASPGDTLLMLQTSGSTGLPKGVLLDHRNVLTRAAACAAVNSLTEHDVSLNWIPLDHVTGVVMFHLRDVFLGARQVHAPTSWVLQDPLRWMELADRHRATVTWAPNFAFGLVGEHAQRLADRTWDLSAMRLVTNAGEVVVASSVRRFLDVLAPFGLAGDVVHPGWGMSETSSVVTDTVLAHHPAPDEGPFVSCGLPYPGFAMRIVDEAGFLVTEGTAGRLQVRGTSVTSGYHDNPTANAEAFDPDGWFETGDLAFLRAGELYITGRAKDVIIVNGVNHYSHEIESCVEELDCVVRSFTAACAVRADAASVTDELALFFQLAPGQDPARALRAVRGKVTREIGVSPAYLVPVGADTIPKTEIGKIQRTQLRKRFEAGEFDGAVQDAEKLLGTAATVPDWFLRPVWQPARRPRPAGPAPRHTLLFAGRGSTALETARTLAGRLRTEGSLCTLVTEGEGFVREDAAHYRLRPDADADHTLLLEALAADHRPLDAVVHLATLDTTSADPDTAAELLAAQRDGTESLLCLTRALAARHTDDTPVSLVLATAGARAVLPGETPSYVHATAPGLLKSLREELPWLRTGMIDLPPAPATEMAGLLLAELSAGAHEEVALRDGRRWVRRLAPLPDRPATAGADTDPAGTRPGGYLVVTGGLGGVGAALAEHLLHTPGTRLLLLGRTVLPPEETWDRTTSGSDTADRAVATLRQLGKLGEVRYEAVDVTDVDALRTALSRTSAAWPAGPTGFLHLAGRFDQGSATGYTRDAWRDAVAAKVLGGWALHRVAREHPRAPLTVFSSVNGHFGGSLSSAYAAANSFLDELAQHRHAVGLPGTSLAWSMWDETGVSEGYPLKALTEARGYRTLDVRTALRAFDFARSLDEPHVLVGADRTTLWIGSQTTGPARPLHRLAGRVALDDGTDLGALHAAAAEAARRCGAPEDWVLRSAGTPSGDTDGSRPREAAGADALTRRTEEAVAAIWRRLLRRDHVAPEENFFDLGGHSLLLVSAQTAVNDELGCALSVVDLFAHPTVRTLARHLVSTGAVTGGAAGNGTRPAAPAAGAPEAAGASALDRARQQVLKQRSARAGRHTANKRTRNDG
ncbi:amino acid adenylation domain-containing protein [Streptomyces sp. NPDC006512]|uniref:amino acid adenylation domain-containing protein n=1 Tax=Streptomyces sp. NPDC006512 TaxID=3154307 RepID=UPI0033ACFDD2